MSDFTIEQLEALKEGTTPGPWGVSEWEDRSRKDAAVFQYDGELLPRIGIVKLKDAELIAAVPELVDALIAEKRENQKLRAEIEAVLDVVKHETWLHDDEGQFPETVQLGSYVAGQLTRILEATDE